MISNGSKDKIKALEEKIKKKGILVMTEYLITSVDFTNGDRDDSGYIGLGYRI